MTKAAIRGIDLLLALLAVVVLSPVLALVALFIWLSDGRPVLFRQTRTGQDERPFDILKFRTLKSHSVEGDRSFFGSRFLRRTSLDELPQLFNIIKGDMSFVGPRPLLPEYGAYYSDEERVRFSVKPGLTGLAQISGRSLLSWDEKLAADVRFVEGYSIRSYLRVLLRTPLVVASGRGATSSWDAESRLDDERSKAGLRSGEQRA